MFELISIMNLLSFGAFGVTQLHIKLNSPQGLDCCVSCSHLNKPKQIKTSYVKKKMDYEGHVLHLCTLN